MRYSEKDGVTYRSDGSATISEGAAGEGAWEVKRGDSGWVVTNPVQGGLRDGDWLRVFDSADDGIHAVIGEPR